MRHPDGYVLERIDDLRSTNQAGIADRQRIRAIMNGGAEGIIALLGDKAAKSMGQDLPVAHLLDSGLNRLAQKLRHPPGVKIPTRRDLDTKNERKRGAKRGRIVAGYDEASRMIIDLMHVARWLPGYGFATWVITERTAANGAPYPHSELRDPYDTYLGPMGTDHQPEDLAVMRLVSKKRLAQAYPTYAAQLSKENRTDGQRGDGQAFIAKWSGGGFEGPVGDTLIAEYHDKTGTYIIIPEINAVVDYAPNPLSGPRYVVAPRPSFDRMVGQYQHSIGVFSMMAKMNVLAFLATEDSVFRETNVIGTIMSGEYERGRFATNVFAPGTSIERPVGDINMQAFQQIDRLERQLRTGANYSQIDDAQSPNSFVTGQGLDRLSIGGDNNISEYQDVLAFALEMLDYRRLEWDDTLYRNKEKPLVAWSSGRAQVENYTPAEDIKGQYLSKRVYGMMAGWDEPQKIVSGLQLLQGGIIDPITFQENLRGLTDIELINERITKHESQQQLLGMLAARAAQGDPTAALTLVEIHKKPADIDDVLSKFFSPEEPQISPEEQQFLQQGGGPGGPGGGAPPTGGPPEAVSTVLSRLMSGGQADGGVQTVGRL